MARALSLELGFEKEASSNPGNIDRSPLLLQGLAVMGVVGNPAYLARHLRLEDTLTLAIYDLSSQPTAVSELSLQLLTMSSRQGQTHPSPFEALMSPTPTQQKEQTIVTYSQFTIYQAPISPVPSRVWEEENLPAWYAYHTTSEANTPFPSNQLQQSTTQVLEPAFEIAQLGHYYFSVYLRVGWHDGGAQTYRVDPEMVVTNNGPVWPLE